MARGALLDLGIEQAGRAGDFAELPGKIRVGVTNDFHAVRLEDEELKVKTRAAGRSARNNRLCDYFRRRQKNMAKPELVSKANVDGSGIVLTIHGINAETRPKPLASP